MKAKQNTVKVVSGVSADVAESESVRPLAPAERKAWNGLVRKIGSAHGKARQAFLSLGGLLLEASERKLSDGTFAVSAAMGIKDPDKAYRAFVDSLGIHRAEASTAKSAAEWQRRLGDDIVVTRSLARQANVLARAYGPDKSGVANTTKFIKKLDVDDSGTVNARLVADKASKIKAKSGKVETRQTVVLANVLADIERLTADDMAKFAASGSRDLVESAIAVLSNVLGMFEN